MPETYDILWPFKDKIGNLRFFRQDLGCTYHRPSDTMKHPAFIGLEAKKLTHQSTDSTPATEHEAAREAATLQRARELEVEVDSAQAQYVLHQLRSQAISPTILDKRKAAMAELRNEALENPQQPLTSADVDAEEVID